ncbi:MAG TPA: hypothetical protein VGK17_10380 [Propionicimonas sp.]
MTTAAAATSPQITVGTITTNMDQQAAAEAAGLKVSSFQSKDGGVAVDPNQLLPQSREGRHRGVGEGRPRRSQGRLVPRSELAAFNAAASARNRRPAQGRRQLRRS